MRWVLIGSNAVITKTQGAKTDDYQKIQRVEESKPYLERSGTLVIPFNAPLKYRWWDGGQTILETLKELGAQEEVIKKY